MDPSSTKMDVRFDNDTFTYKGTSWPWVVSDIRMEQDGYYYRGSHNPITITVTGYSTGSSNYTVKTDDQKKEEEKKVDKSRGLFLGFVVDPAMDELIYASDRPFVAADEEHAKLKIVQKAGGSLSKEVDDYDIIILRLGKVRAKKEVQTVKVVKD
jgi:hypothetical protein